MVWSAPLPSCFPGSPWPNQLPHTAAAKAPGPSGMGPTRGVEAHSPGRNRPPPPQVPSEPTELPPALLLGPRCPILQTRTLRGVVRGGGGLTCLTGVVGEWEAVWAHLPASFGV